MAIAQVTLTTTAVYEVLAEKTEWKGPLRSCSCRQEKDAATGHQEMCCDEALWIHLLYGGDQQGTAVNKVGPGVLRKAENVLNSRSNIILCRMELVVGWLIGWLVGWLVGEENSQSSQCVWTENVFHFGINNIFKLTLLLLLLLLLLCLLSPLRTIFTIMYLRNTPCFYGTRCCSRAVVTLCATCSAISHVQCYALDCTSALSAVCVQCAIWLFSVVP